LNKDNLQRGGTMSDLQFEKIIQSIPKTAIQVITNPIGFFRSMPASGGFLEPLLFMVAMGLISGVLQAIISIVGLGHGASFFMALASVILVPVFIAIFGFVGAGIFYIIWKLMGSSQSYETAYRCGAYMGAIVPITAVLGIIPYAGAVASLAWMMYLTVIASIEVHKISSQKAWIVFGIVFVFFAIINISAEHTSRNFQKQMGQFGGQMENMKEMTPEEAGKAMGEFVKGFQKGSGK